MHRISQEERNKYQGEPENGATPSLNDLLRDAVLPPQHPLKRVQLVLHTFSLVSSSGSECINWYFASSSSISGAASGQASWERHSVSSKQALFSPLVLLNFILFSSARFAAPE